MKRSAGIFAAALALAACLMACGCAGEAGSADSAITVSASITTEVTPDRASIGIVAPAGGDTAEAARKAGEEVARRISDACRALGVPAENISAPQVSLAERVGEVDSTEYAGGYEDEWGNWIEPYEMVSTSTQVVGYDAAVRLDVTDFDATVLDRLLRDTAAAGATAFDALVFNVSDQNEAYEQALTQAVDAAHAKAEVLAKAGGVYVGRVVNLVEGAAGEFVTTIEDDASVINPADESTMNVAPSKTSVQATVTVSYAIS